MRSVLQTPHGDLRVVDPGGLKGVEESSAQRALIKFLSSEECQVFDPAAVATYKTNFAIEKNRAHVVFALRYKPWLESVMMVRGFVTLVFLGGAVLSFVAMMLLAVAALGTFVFSYATFGTMATWCGICGALTITGALANFGLGRAIAAIVGPRLERFRLEAAAYPEIRWESRGIDLAGPIPQSVRDMMTNLTRSFSRSHHSRAFHLVFSADVAIGVSYHEIATKETIVDPFLIISFVHKNDRTEYASAPIAVWDETGFAATLHHPSQATTSSTV